MRARQFPSGLKFKQRCGISITRYPTRFAHHSVPILNYEHYLSVTFNRSRRLVPSGEMRKCVLRGPAEALVGKEGPLLERFLCAQPSPLKGSKKGHAVRHTVSANRQHRRDCLGPLTEPRLDYRSTVEVKVLANCSTKNKGPSHGETMDD